MNLLNEVMQRPLDPGYQQATDRRRAAGDPPASLWHRASLLLLAIGLGLVTATATADLRAPEPAVAQARTLLESQIEERTTVAAQLERDNASRSREITRLQDAAIGGSSPALAAQLEADGIGAGTAAVDGPGLRIVLEDSAAARENLAEADPDQRVQDFDLQIAVNGLWAAGAEAIGVNGHRLTSVTAIRSAGSAILVDLTPLSGPYVVEAIGDPARMATRFARTTAGPHLTDLRNTYGIESTITSQSELALPGSTPTRLWSATVPGEVAPTGVASSSSTKGRNNS